MRQRRVCPKYNLNGNKETYLLCNFFLFLFTTAISWAQNMAFLSLSPHNNCMKIGIIRFYLYLGVCTPYEYSSFCICIFSDYTMQLLNFACQMLAREKKQREKSREMKQKSTFKTLQLGDFHCTFIRRIPTQSLQSFLCQPLPYITAAWTKAKIYPAACFRILGLFIPLKDFFIVIFLSYSVGETPRISIP